MIGDTGNACQFAGMRFCRFYYTPGFNYGKSGINRMPNKNPFEDASPITITLKIAIFHWHVSLLVGKFKSHKSQIHILYYTIMVSK